MSMLNSDRFVDTYLFIPTSKSGVALYAAELTQALSAAGYRSHALVAPSDFEFSEDIKSNSVPLLPVPPIGGNSPIRKILSMFSQIFHFHRLLRRRAKAPAVVHLLTNYPAAVQLLTQLLVKSTGCRVLLTVHDVIPHSQVRGSWSSYWSRLVFGMCYKQADQLHVHTTSQQRQLADMFGIESKHIRFIPHGMKSLSSSDWHPDGRSLRPLKLLMIGAIRRNKRIIEAIEALRLAQEKDTVLTICGASSHSEARYLSEVKTAVSNSPARVNLELGFLAEQEFDVKLREHHVVLMPYADFSSQSGVLLRSLRVGTFAICSQAVAGDLPIQECLEISIASTCEPSDIARAIDDFANVPPEVVTVRMEKLYSRVCADLSWQAISMQFLNWYVQEKSRC